MIIEGLRDGDCVLVAVPRYEGQTSWQSKDDPDVIEIFTIRYLSGFEVWRSVDVPDDVMVVFVRVRNLDMTTWETLAAPADTVEVERLKLERNYA